MKMNFHHYSTNNAKLIFNESIIIPLVSKTGNHVSGAI